MKAESWGDLTVARVAIALAPERVKIARLDNDSWMCCRDGDRVLLVRHAADVWCAIGTKEDLKNSILAALSAARLQELDTQHQGARDRGVVVPFARKGGAA